MSGEKVSGCWLQRVSDRFGPPKASPIQKGNLSDQAGSNKQLSSSTHSVFLKVKKELTVK